MLWRTLLDDTALLMWFVRHRDQLEELALRFYYTGANRSARIQELAAANGYDWATEMETERLAELEAIHEAAAEGGITLRELPHTFQLLQDLQQEKLYYWHVHASQIIHSTPIGLSQRLRIFAGSARQLALVSQDPQDVGVATGLRRIRLWRDP